MRKMSSRKWSDEDFILPQTSPPSLKKISCSSAKKSYQKEGLLLKSNRKEGFKIFQRMGEISKKNLKTHKPRKKKSNQKEGKKK
jgi:hypothetical protein